MNVQIPPGLWDGKYAHTNWSSVYTCIAKSGFCHRSEVIDIVTRVGVVAYFSAKGQDGLSLSLPTADISAVRGSSHYSWASWSRCFVYFLANGVCLAECSKQFFNKFWVVFQADFCVLWVKSCSVRQDGAQKYTAEEAASILFELPNNGNISDNEDELENDELMLLINLIMSWKTLTSRWGLQRTNYMDR